MPVTTTYPGVYVEEVPSGVRTITGVATSIAAFVGRAARGPVDEPVVINGYGDFERIFGGLWRESSLGFAVRDFYLNGGGQAIVVRIFRAGTGANERSRATLEVANLKLEAANEGSWGNRLRFRVDHTVSPEVAGSLGVPADDLFNLTVRDMATGFTETFLNVTRSESARRIDRILTAESRLVRTGAPASSARPAKHPDLAPGADPWSDANSAKVETTGTTAGNATDGQVLDQGSFVGGTREADKTGLYALEKADIFNLLSVPPYLAAGTVDVGLVTAAAAYCERRRAMFLVDPRDWTTKTAARSAMENPATNIGTNSKNAALFFPRLRQPNPFHSNALEPFAPSGAVAGVFARTDAQRGVWKAPAGLDATLVGVPELSVVVTEPENGELNPLGLNCLRVMPGVGPVVWGARTLQGADRLASEWKYIPVRRTALFLEESLYRGTQWVVFEPNDEPLWSQIRLNVGAFMHSLFRQGAFAGTSPRDAYFVKCDSETTTADDQNRGVVNVHVGFAPLKPAEFVILKIQQIAGQIAT
jgi:phage tail sheath protein FI